MGVMNVKVDILAVLQDVRSTKGMLNQAAGYWPHDAWPPSLAEGCKSGWVGGGSICRDSSAWLVHL